ncbi:hypothetical protein ABXN37_29055 [Piscinibacter sakaiensis]|uniref:Uncharacterized protein n=1 Tax=Piscinibacter sakaiensis TaxID=1547922 RepID=A0A0K8P8U0_PISS1|nr:hypothetical protein [Piscinibacter sakaiensis]GAP39063.1 hypothetical protein ISF6_0928 [Piscinibacter sakaiensis]
MQQVSPALIALARALGVLPTYAEMVGQPRPQQTPLIVEAMRTNLNLNDPGR